MTFKIHGSRTCIHPAAKSFILKRLLRRDSGQMIDALSKDIATRRQP